MAVSGVEQGKTPESLVTPAFAGFSPIAENGTKAALTTGLTTDRKIFEFLPRRGIMTEIEYPGIAQLVARQLWENTPGPPHNFISGCSAVGSALALGARCREFESPHSDQMDKGRSIEQFS